MAYRDDFCAFMALLVGELTNCRMMRMLRVTSTSTTVVPVTTTSITTTASSTVGTTTTTTSTQPSSSTTEEVSFYIIGSAINYSNYLHNNIVPFDSITPTATDTLDDSKSENGVLAQLIGGSTSLSVDMLQECPVGESGSILDPIVIVLGGLGDTLVEDVSE